MRKLLAARCGIKIRPTIAELEEMLHQPDNRKIRIEPDGTVREMSEEEFKQNELMEEIDKLRARLKDIEKLAAEK